MKTKYQIRLEKSFAGNHDIYVIRKWSWLYGWIYENISTTYKEAEAKLEQLKLEKANKKIKTKPQILKEVAI